MIGRMDALPQTIDAVIPVHVSVPSDFKRVQMDCCLIPKVRILAYWSDGEDDFSPNINLLEEKTSATSLLEYLPTIVSLPGQTLKLLGFVERCGHAVALLSVAGIMGNVRMVGTQSIVWSQSNIFTTTYMRRSSESASAKAVDAVRNVCVTTGTSS